MIQCKNVFYGVMEVHDFIEEHQQGKDTLNVLQTSYGEEEEHKNQLNNLGKLSSRT